MLTTGCIHPLILRHLALCGHGDKILICDGNYPLDARTGDAAKVHLALRPGLPSVVQVLESLRGVAVFEAMELMLNDGALPPAAEEYGRLLGLSPAQGWSREEFYRRCALPDVRLAISTGERRPFANVLLTLGCA